VNPSECRHVNFEAIVEVILLRRDEDRDREESTLIPIARMAHIIIRCAACHTDFEWVGLPSGQKRIDGPSVSTDSKELRVPIRIPGAALPEVENFSTGRTN
jgi:hypothetical protein